MRSLTKLLFLAVLPALLVVGCGPPWVVLRQASPNVITTQTQLAIDNTTFNALMVGKKTEADYLARKKPEEQQSFQNDKLSFIGGFLAGVQGNRGTLDVAGPEALEGRFSIRSNVQFLEPGSFNGFVNVATEMRTKITISDASQQPVDEIEIHCVVPADLYRPGVGMRITECGNITGTWAARYLKQRAGLK